MMKARLIWKIFTMTAERKYSLHPIRESDLPQAVGRFRFSMGLRTLSIRFGAPVKMLVMYGASSRPRNMADARIRRSVRKSLGCIRTGRLPLAEQRLHDKLGVSLCG